MNPTICFCKYIIPMTQINTFEASIIRTNSHKSKVQKVRFEYYIQVETFPYDEMRKKVKKKNIPRALHNTFRAVASVNYLYKPFHFQLMQFIRGNVITAKYMVILAHAGNVVQLYVHLCMLLMIDCITVCNRVCVKY